MKTLTAILVIVSLALFTQTSFASGTLPISTMRDYNGTYIGTPGTGTVDYSVLYRDNEDSGATSGCNGEGCGMHPGVDISVASGSDVYAAFGGTVVRSECDASWGGIIVIRSSHPYSSGYIYTTYAHLRGRDYALNDSVSEGNVIGESGGAAGDTCHGSSTGSHLHFQIDNDDDGTYPWWPNSPYDVDGADDDFVVTDHTYNPIPFVTEAYYWSFQTSGSSEYWQPRNESYWGVTSGYLWIDGGSDPGVSRSGDVSCGLSEPCSGQIAAEADLYPYVWIELDSYCTSNPAKIYFTTSEDDTWSEAKSVSFNYSGATCYWIDMSGNAYWTGVVRRIRIDPAVNCNPYASDASMFSSIGISM
jgi:hypothetical protein